MKETKTSTLKAKFRSSKMWKDFRKKVYDLQDGKDPISGRKLLKGANLHHKILTNDMDVYRDTSNTDNYIFLNKKNHEFIHFGLDLVKHNGLNALTRYVSELLKECVLNEYITREELEEFING